MTKAIEILEQEIKELQEAVDKLKEGQGWTCVVKCKTKPVEQKTIDISQVKEVQVTKSSYIFFKSSFLRAYIEGDTLNIEIND